MGKSKKKPSPLATLRAENKKLLQLLSEAEYDRRQLRDQKNRDDTALIEKEMVLEAERQKHDKTDGKLKGLLVELAGRKSAFDTLVPLIQSLFDRLKPDTVGYHIARALQLEVENARMYLGSKLPTDDPKTWTCMAKFSVSVDGAAAQTGSWVHRDGSSIDIRRAEESHAFALDK